MNSVASILEGAFERVRKSGRDVGKGAAGEAAFLEISPAHYSRLRNGHVPLTNKLIDKMVKAFAEGDEDYARKLEEELKAARGGPKSREGKAVAAAESLLDKYAVEGAAGSLFDKLCNDNSLLVICYRDLAQAVNTGAYPGMSDKARMALQCGLRMALCQPFGSYESLMRKHNEVAQLIEENQLQDSPQAISFPKAYLYLCELARRVRQFYEKMLEDPGPGKGQVVLYEADVENPLPVACGIQSRLFFADYQEASHQEASHHTKHQTKIYEWVAVAGEEHFFVERSHLSLDIEAVKLQFNPIPAYWDKYRRLPGDGDEMERAYAEFGLQSLFRENKGEVKWKVWSK